MGFFIFDEVGGLLISRKAWLYPAIVLPLTMMVFAIWLLWIKFRLKKADQGMAKQTVKDQQEHSMEEGNDEIDGLTTGKLVWRNNRNIAISDDW